MIYVDRLSGLTIDHSEHLLGRTCCESGCDRPAGTPWGPYFCHECDMERRERITRNLEVMARKLDGKVEVER